MQKCPQITVHAKGQKQNIPWDFEAEANVQEARKYCSLFFSNNHLSEPFQTPFQWAFYDRFFLEIALPYSKYKPLLDQCLHSESIEYSGIPDDFCRLLKAFCFHYGIVLLPADKASRKLSTKASAAFKSLFSSFWKAFLIAYSLGSILILILPSKKKRIAVWTGDYLGSFGNLDPRLGDLESKMAAKNFQAIPLIRSTGVKTKKSIENFRKRKGPLIYYEYLNDLLAAIFLNRSKPKKQPELLGTIFHFLYNKAAQDLPKQIKIWRWALKRTHTRAFISWFLSSRTAALLWAAKANGLPTIGFMHGISVMTYMGHEFMPEYEGPPLGPDVFGTWSAWWQQYFLEHSKIYPRQGIEISGPLKHIPLQSTPSSRSRDQIRIYIVAEAHLPVGELLPYLQILNSDPKYDIIFKIRPFGRDQFWEKFVHHPIYRQYQYKTSSEPTPSCFLDADIVIGTHSTAVFEALSLSKPILFLNSKKWGDYFDFQKSFGESCCFFAQSPQVLENRISAVLDPQNQSLWTQIFLKFIGVEDGSDWIVRKLIEKTKSLAPLRSDDFDSTEAGQKNQNRD